jgi:hypothetical protein
MASDVTDRVIVPAEKGWEVVTYGYKDPTELFYDPVIAFVIERHEGDYHPSARKSGRWVGYDVIPVMIDGAPSQRWALKRPDGKYEDVRHARFDTEEELKEHFKELEKEEA